jgi:flagellar protein FlaG
MSTAPIASFNNTAAPQAGAAPARAVPAATPAPQAQKSADDKTAQPSSRDVHEAVKKIEQLIQPAARDLRFSVDEDTGITVVKLIDTETQTVLRQIPTPEVIEISKALDKLQGLLVKEKA